MGLVVFAFMALSLAVTATGTARFAVAMGYSPIVGYVVGAIFEFAKEILPLAIRALCKRRALVISIILSIAWIGLVTYSVLATHATITTAISAIERTGTQKMEGRANEQKELKSAEQQLGSLSQPRPPRPVKTVRAALAATKVPPGIWKDSRECAAIQESAYFAKACAQVVQLRTELSTAEDYERLSAWANELRTNLAETPIIATSDPLPEAFAATLGRILHVGGTEGVAQLLTVVVEIISCVGLAALSALYNSDDQTSAAGSGGVCSLSEIRDGRGRGQKGIKKILPGPAKSILPCSSLKPAAAGRSNLRSGTSEERTGSSSNIIPIRPTASSLRESDPDPQQVEGGSAGSPCNVGSHVTAFARGRLRDVPEDSSGREDLQALKNVLPEPSETALSGSSSKSAAAGQSKPRSRLREERPGSSSNVVQMRPAPSSPRHSDADPEQAEGGPAGSPYTPDSHVPAFVQDRLRRTPGVSLGATDLRDAYVGWCTKHGYVPLSPQKLAAELAAMGFTKWKSCGRMRYCNVICSS
jgi:hypothetical protein